MSAHDYYAIFARQRAVLHENLWRTIASYFCNPISRVVIHPCRMRKCRRDGVCCGSMVPSERLQQRIQMLRDVGLQTTAGTTLPLCVASADDSTFAALENEKRETESKVEEWSTIPWAELSISVKLSLRELARNDAALDAAENV
jgi:hypothetical protein